MTIEATRAKKFIELTGLNFSHFVVFQIFAQEGKTFQKLAQDHDSTLLSDMEYEGYFRRSETITDDVSMISLKLTEEGLGLKKLVFSRTTSTSDVEDIVGHLNLTKREAGLSSRFTCTASTTKLVQYWLDRGKTVEDFKTVHKHFVKEFAGTEWEKYLRPVTLYSKEGIDGRNFEWRIEESQIDNKNDGNSSKYDRL